ncbi:MAG: histidinol-phosphate transaminase [Halioglobus sp.]|nr:histidinol-phosphate transaminase [Halioglobus sp.]
MSRYWSDLVGQLTPYVPGEQPQHERLVKLNTNENPYPPSPAVLAAIARVSADSLRLYPDPDSTALKRAFAARHELEPEQVFVGNGSDEVLAHTFQALLKHRRPVCFPDVSYSFYPVWCDLYGIEYTQVPLTDEFRVDPADYPADNGGIVIANPNAPTGVLLELDAIRQLLLRSSASVVVIDEAYIDFGGASAVALLAEFDNLLVVQTLSKSRALAGVRVGVAMGSAALIEGLERVKNSFNSYPLDIIAQRATLASLADEAYFEASRRRVIDSRDKLGRDLAALGFEVLPSAANFLFATHPRRAATELFGALRKQGIIVRHFDRPRIRDFLRISVGTDEQCATLLQALRGMLG